MAKHGDPDGALARVRDYIKYLSTVDSAAIRAVHVRQFAEDVQYLDQLMTTGGALPSSWADLAIDPSSWLAPHQN